MGRGICQGDPIAPFLFLIIAEGLNGLLRQAVVFDKFKGFKFGGLNGEEIYIYCNFQTTHYSSEKSLEETHSL